MNPSTSWILIAIMAIIAILAVIAVVFHQGKPAKPDYYTLFILGAIWLPFGLIMKNPGLWSIGIVFTVIGLINRGKWEKDRKSWDKMTKKEREAQLIIVGVLTFMLAAGVTAFWLVR